MLKSLLAVMITFYSFNVIAAELDIDPPFEELEPAGSSKQHYVRDLIDLLVRPLSKERLDAELAQLEKNDISARLQQISTYSIELSHIMIEAMFGKCPKGTSARHVFYKMAWNRINLIQRLISHSYNNCLESDQDTLKIFATVNQLMSQKLNNPQAYSLKDQQTSIDFCTLLMGEVLPPLLELLLPILQ